MWLAVLIGAVISAILYRLGGIGKPFRSWMRDWLIPIVSFIVVFFILKIKAPWWGYLLMFGATGGALTTYWDSLLGYDNFYAHGAVIALSTIFLGNFIGTGLYVIVLGGLMGLWCKIFSNDWVEELGRGFLIIATLPLLLIGA